MSLLERVEQTLASRRWPRRGQAVLVAVSGGVDSMVLLRMLHALAGRQAWRLTVAHFNHQLRGRSSLADERLVRATAARLGLPCVVERGAVRELARTQKVSVEMAARKLRHAFLARTARALGIRVVALAHHADDQVELFFLRLLRGASPSGLAGMKERNPSPADPRVMLVRPLLDLPKAELVEFARQERVAFREDVSNAALDFQRNRIRHELLPLLVRHYQPALAKVVPRLMDLLGTESECMEAALDRGGAGRRFDALPVALQRRILQRQLVAAGMEPDFELIERLRQAADKPVSLDGNRLAARDRDGQLRVGTAKPVQFAAGELRVSLEGSEGRIEFAGATFRWRKTSPRRGTMPGKKPGCEWFDAARVGPEVILRHWRAGDRFQPIGMTRAVKLQDLFTNAKVPRAERHRRVVASTASGELWWVEGLRISERFKLGQATRQRLQWQDSPRAKARADTDHFQSQVINGATARLGR